LATVHEIRQRLGIPRFTDTQVEMCYNRRASIFEVVIPTMKKLLIVLIIVAVVAATVFIVATRTGSQAESVGDSIRQAQVARDDMVIAVSATGSIVPKSEARLSFDVPGRVARVAVETGDAVAAVMNLFVWMMLNSRSR